MSVPQPGGAEVEPPAATGIEDPRYGCNELKTCCPHCGRPLILNGPWREPLCDHCNQRIRLGPGLWKTLLGGLENNYHRLQWGHGGGSTSWTGGFDFDITWYRLRPRCRRCKTELDHGSVPTGTKATLTCPECGKETSSFPAPGWLKKSMPTAAQIFGAKHEEAESKQQKQPEPAATVADGGPRPIMLTCPRCGGSFKVTGDSTRTESCTYCQSDVLLPDEVWRRFHRARVMKQWFIRFEGETPKLKQQADKRVAKNQRDQAQRKQRTRKLWRARILMALAWPLILAAVVLWFLWAATVISASSSGTPTPWGSATFIALALTAGVGLGLTIAALAAIDGEAAGLVGGLLVPVLLPLVGLINFFVFIVPFLREAEFPKRYQNLHTDWALFLALFPFLATTNILLWFISALRACVPS